MTRLAPIALVLLAACDFEPPGVTPGESGELEFYEPNTYPNDGLFTAVGLDTPVAVGAAADIGVYVEDDLVLTGTSDAPEVFEVEEDGGAYVRVRALAEGAATIAVTTDDEREDAITLSSLPVDDTQIFVNEGLFAGAVQHATATANGYALRPEASLRLSATPLSAGSPLLGFDLFTWEDTDAALTILAVDEPVNTVRITNPGTAGLSVVQTQLGGEFEVMRLDETTEPTLLTYDIQDIENPVEITVIEGENVDFFALIPYDEAGRFVQPSTTDVEDFAVTAVSGDVVVLSATWADGGVFLNVCQGTGVIALSLANGTVERSITVTADQAAEGC